MMQLSQDRPAATELWRGRSRSELPGETDTIHAMVTTPIIIGDHVYGVDSYGELRALDAATGERVWMSPDMTAQARWSTAFLVRHRDRYFVNNDEGFLILARFTPEGYVELDRTRLIEPTGGSGTRTPHGPHCRAPRQLVAPRLRERPHRPPQRPGDHPRVPAGGRLLATSPPIVACGSARHTTAPSRSPYRSTAQTASRGKTATAAVCCSHVAPLRLSCGAAQAARFTHHQEGMLARVKKLTEAMTKTQMFADIAEKTALTRRQVADVFGALDSVIERHVRKGAVGVCTIPGLMKIKIVKKPARRAKKGVPNPFRPGETMDVKARPASTTVKILPLKKLKDMA